MLGAAANAYSGERWTGENKFYFEKFSVLLNLFSAFAGVLPLFKSVPCFKAAIRIIFEWCGSE